MNITFHYPPELFNLLVDTIPLLCRTKGGVLLFFRGAGVAYSYFSDLEARVTSDRTNISKYEIVQTILKRLNEKGEVTLRERREILKRVTEFESFSSCWPAEQLKARGLVAEICQVVNVKDSFTRMNLEREREAQKHKEKHLAKVAEIQNRQKELALIRSDLSGLFLEADVYKRGKKLESVLNKLFGASGILIREAFTLCGSEKEGLVEQIDGVIEIDGVLYLVEMKWWDKPLGTGDVSQHLVRIFNRGHARGIFISAAGYTRPAVSICRESLSQATVVLCVLEEIVRLLECEGDLKSMLKEKIQVAIIDKNPFYKIY